MVFTRALRIASRMRSEDRREVLVGETLKCGGMTESPINPFNTMHSSEFNRVGHFHFDP